MVETSAKRRTVEVAELAELLGCSARLVYDEVTRGNVRALHLGRRVLIPDTEVERLLSAPAR
ncbi:MAG: excisionase family DNA-binding protein [Dehalococcoidia bacterium]